MFSRILTGGLAAGAAMLAMTAAPASAFTLSGPSSGADGRVRETSNRSGMIVGAAGIPIVTAMAGIAHGATAGIAIAGEGRMAGCTAAAPVAQDLVDVRPRAQGRTCLALQLRHQHVGDLEIRRDCLNVVVFLQCPD